MHHLELRNLNKSFREPQHGTPLAVLRDITLTVDHGQFVCVVGPSGCGKSTLLRLVAGLILPDAGEVMIDGAVVRGAGTDRGMVFQQGNLLPWRTALGNVEYGLEMRGVPRRERREQAQHYLTLVGLVGFENYLPVQLSGGMQQRVGLARALAIEPKMLLMDEPFAAVDAMTRETLQLELLRIWELRGCTVLFITHDIGEAVFMGQRVVVMGAKPGTIAQDIAISLPQPRADEMRNTPAFAEVRGEVAHALRAAAQR
jgi:NitT/TauT family transport system ATP-binding protein